MPEVEREAAGDHPADLRDVQPEEHARERLLLRALDRLPGARRRDLGESLELGELLRGEPVEVRQRADDPLVPELLDRASADVLDVERRPDPVVQRLQAARRARAVRAAVHDLALGPHDLRRAERAALRHPPRLRARLVLARGPDDLRDHVTGALDDHEVADADVLAPDVVLVVQRRARHGDAADVHRLELRERVQHARAADADVDRDQARHRRGRRPLERTREARAAVQRAETALLVERVDLDHDAVDLVPESGSPLLPRDARVGDLVDRLEALGVRVRAEPAARSHSSASHCERELDALEDADPVDEDRERPLGGDARVELSQRACRRVPRVRRGLPPRGELRLVEAHEALEREVDLAPHLDHGTAARPPSIRSGIASIVRRLAVTSSPRSPSPRVAPRTSAPSS